MTDATTSLPSVQVADPELVGQLTALRQTLAPDLNDNELQLFALVARHHGLDPFVGQIRAVKRAGRDGARVTFQTGIDGYRSIAERTGEYDGSDDPVFGADCPCTEAPRPHPESATVMVYRAGRRPQPGTVYWHEIKPEQDFMWRRMPRAMLAKCAEALALRKSFPATFADLYTTDEMAQADEPEAEPREPATKRAREAVRAKARQVAGQPAEDAGDSLVITEDAGDAGGGITVDGHQSAPEPEAPGDENLAEHPEPVYTAPSSPGPEPALAEAIAPSGGLLEATWEPLSAHAFTEAVTRAGISRAQVVVAAAELFPDLPAKQFTDAQWGALYAVLTDPTVVVAALPDDA